MGCDIHFYVERREGDRWVTADRWTPDEYSPEGPLTVDYKDQFYTGRNYDLFAMLANVRNGSGFAGIKTSDGFVPICEPRGIPEDACDEFRRMVEEYGADGHSHSYLTAAELQAYDWTQVVHKVGWVGITEWARAKNRPWGAPESYSGAVGGGGVRHLAPADFDAAWEQVRVANGWPEGRHPSAHLNDYSAEGKVAVAMMVACLGGGSPYCQLEWDVPYYQQAREFLGTVLPRLWKLGAPEDVRCVFFFDN